MPQSLFYNKLSCVAKKVVRFSRILAISVCVIVAYYNSGCTPSQESYIAKWSYSDLRTLDPPDAPSADLDLIALYVRHSREELQIRIDLLDTPDVRNFDFYVAFDFEPGGRYELYNTTFGIEGFYWEYVVDIPIGGKAHVYDQDHNLITDQVKVYQDSFLDSIYLSIPIDMFTPGVSSKIPPFRILVATVRTDTNSLYDVVGPVLGDQTPPAGYSVILSFWDTFKAQTPAQALRSWDGAHTGPNRERHGLRHLLEAVTAYKIPIMLEDLTSVSHRYAFEYLGVSDFVVSIFNGNVVFGSGFIDCNIYYGYTNTLFIDASQSPTESGLSEETVRQLLELALQGRSNSGKVIVLRAPLTGTNWGNPDMADKTMAYLSQHPWINLAGNSMLNNPNKGSRVVNNFCLSSSHNNFYSQPIALADLRIISTFSHMMANTPKNQLSEYGRSIYAEILSNSTIPDIQWGQIINNSLVPIFKAAKWASSPTPLSSCSSDLDFDGSVECVLASESLYAIFELNGGYLSYLAYITPDGNPHQIIGSQYALISFLGGAITPTPKPETFTQQMYAFGAFTDDSSNLSILLLKYHYTLSQDTLTLFTPDSSGIKTFTVTDSTIKANFDGSLNVNQLEIPVIIDPWTMANPNWAEAYSIIAMSHNTLEVSIEDVLSIQITSLQEPIIESFITPWKFISSPEDPNINYSSGYFLPFSMTKITYSYPQTHTIEMRLVP